MEMKCFNWGCIDQVRTPGRHLYNIKIALNSLTLGDHITGIEFAAVILSKYFKSQFNQIWELISFGK